MKIKRYAADIQFSFCVRERANWKCQACGNDYRERPQGLDCSHIFSRGVWATRFTPANAVAHCVGCHVKLGNNPILFARWAEKLLGNEMIELLLEKSECKQRAKRARADNKAGLISKHYREQYNALRVHRQHKPNDYLHFLEYD